MCESYVVRIYRRDKKDPEGIVGLVEVVGTGETRKFIGIDDLGRIFRAGVREERNKRSRQGEDESGGKGRPR